MSDHVVLAWEAALAAFADCLQRHRTLLHSDDTEHALPAFVPPGGLPAIPAQLRGRAELLLHEARALERVSAERLSQLRRTAAVDGTQVLAASRGSRLDARG